MLNTFIDSIRIPFRTLCVLFLLFFVIFIYRKKPIHCRECLILCQPILGLKFPVQMYSIFLNKKRKFSFEKSLKIVHVVPLFAIEMNCFNGIP